MSFGLAATITAATTSLLASSVAAGTISAGLAGGLATGAGIVGTGLAAGAVGAGLGAGQAALTGGDVGKGALMGGVTGVVGGGLGAGLGALGTGAALGGGALGGATEGLIAGAAGGAAGAAAGGEDVGKGALLGGAVGGIGGALTGGIGGNAAGEPADVVETSISKSPNFQAATSPSGTTTGALNPTIPVSNGITSANNMSPMQVMKNATPVAGTGAMYPNAKIPINSLGSAGAPAFNAATGISPTSTSGGVSSAIESGTNFIKDNPAVAMQLGGAALASMGGTPSQEKTPESVYNYTPSTYVPPTIERTSVPQYYNPTGSYGYTGYAEGGAVDSAQQNGMQPNGQMNPIVARAMQQAQLQQPQQPVPQPPASQGIMGAQAQPMMQQPMMQQPPMGQPMGGMVQPTQNAANGGMMRDNLGDYSHGGIAGLTSAVGSGVSDDIPAQIGTSGKQPARLAANEFVIPARAVSELGQGSSEAGAKQLQAMVDRIQAGRKKSIGKGKIAVDSKAIKHLPA